MVHVNKGPRSSEDGFHHVPFVLWLEPSLDLFASHTCSHLRTATHIRSFSHIQHMPGKTKGRLLIGPARKPLGQTGDPGDTTLPLPSALFYTASNFYTLHKSHTAPQKDRRQTLCLDKGFMVHCSPGNVAGSRSNLNCTASLPYPEHRKISKRKCPHSLLNRSHYVAQAS